MVAIFKHGLWDLDVVIKKALVAFVLTLLIVGVGLAAILVLRTVGVAGRRSASVW